VFGVLRAAAIARAATTRTRAPPSNSLPQNNNNNQLNQTHQKNNNQQQRYLFMKLTYHDATPDAYEPPAFEPAGDAGVGHFKCRPFSMCERLFLCGARGAVCVCVLASLFHPLLTPRPLSQNTLTLTRAAQTGASAPSTPTTTASACASSRCSTRATPLGAAGAARAARALPPRASAASRRARCES
jgi:hypothetical protein